MSLPASVTIVPTCSRLVRNTVRLVKSEFEAANIQLTFKTTKKELYHSIDEQLIEMVLINLIKNAREAFNSSENKLVIIEAGEKDRAIFISITDNGTGVTDEAKERFLCRSTPLNSEVLALD